MRKNKKQINPKTCDALKLLTAFLTFKLTPGFSINFSRYIETKNFVFESNSLGVTPRGLHKTKYLKILITFQSQV